MSEQPPVPPTTQDFPDRWGFYLLQAINRLDDKINGLNDKINGLNDKIEDKIGEVRRDQERTADGLRQEMHALDTKFDQKLTTLQYSYWGTLFVIVIGFVTLFFAHHP